MERGSKRQVSHVFHGDENDQITVLKGTEADVADAFKDCKRRNRTFAIRHWIISPHEAMTREQLLAVVWMLCMEFGADYESAVIVEHDKPRVDPQACSRHLHVLVPENTIKGRVLDSRHSYARHEKIARVAEHDNGIFPSATAANCPDRARPGGIAPSHSEAVARDRRSQWSGDGPAAARAARATWRPESDLPGRDRGRSVCRIVVAVGPRQECRCQNPDGEAQ